MAQSWNGTPAAIKVTGCQGSGGLLAQLWAITEGYQLIYTQSTADQGWTSWSQPNWNGAPSQILDVAAAQQGDGRAQVFVIDDQQQLWTAWQLSPGGAWSGFAGPNWNGAQTLQMLCASAQGGSCGVQVFAVAESGAIVSANQNAPGDDWSGWYAFNGPVPVMGLTASMQNDPRVQVYALDQKQSLWTNWQTAPGNGWATFAGPGWNTPPGPLSCVAAAAQGGTRGAQLWGIDANEAVWTCYQASSGDDWSGWIGPGWAGSPNVVQIAAVQRSDGCVQVWAVDDDLQVWTIIQSSPGGDWGSWSNS